MPLIIAHRGASALAPENTMAAFRLARELGADGIELDVMLSADEELVVIHDDSLERTTNGEGKVADLTWAEMQPLDAGSKFNPAFAGEHLPTLSQVYEEMGGSLLIDVELKNYSHPYNQLPNKAVALTQKFNLLDSVLFSSFNPANLSAVRKLEPKIKLGLLAESGKSGALWRTVYGRTFPFDAFHPYFSDVNAAMVKEQHRLGRQVNPWTVDDPQELKRLQGLGVDMVICNDPARARAILEG